MFFLYLFRRSRLIGLSDLCEGLMTDIYIYLILRFTKLVTNAPSSGHRITDLVSNFNPYTDVPCLFRMKWYPCSQYLRLTIPNVF
jgi:hypothetical protein